MGVSKTHSLCMYPVRQMGADRVSLCRAVKYIYFFAIVLFNRRMTCCSLLLVMGNRAAMGIVELLVRIITILLRKFFKICVDY